MAVLECTHCGGMNELPAGKSLWTCLFCGSQITLPCLTDENHVAAFNRGNHFRRIGEFDKALAVYERIVREDEGNAEAHWCCALCRFGIEYVRDDATGEYLPTCHRASYDSFLEDVDYLAALEHAAADARAHYQQQAEQIAAVLRGVLAISQSAEPFDVFLCYKENGADGQRTHDSAIAQDIYYQLTDHGLRVFFARITLEDKPGVEYEPYIFAALNSARVMVVVGTKPEHLNAVWVRNEWSRFHALMKRDRSRLLIPCYRDMDPYDMPDELAVLQSYDVSRIGFVQDLVRGIRKVVGDAQPAAPAPQAAPVQSASPATDPLLRRVALFLEDGDWHSADEYCERVLDIDPECARAYVGKLMAALQVPHQAKLKDQPQPFDQNPHYIKAVRFADDALAAELRGMIAHINERNEYAAKDAAYRKAEEALRGANYEMDYLAAQKQFLALGAHRDAAARAQECETARLDFLYRQAEDALSVAGSEREFIAVHEQFLALGAHRDAAARAQECETARLNLLYSQAEQALAAAKKEQDFVKAQKMFMALENWRDSAARAQACETARLDWLYSQAEQTLAEAKGKAAFLNAQQKFRHLGNYRDAEERVQACETAWKESAYNRAITFMNQSPTRANMTEAEYLFRSIPGWRDADEQAEACQQAIRDIDARKEAERKRQEEAVRLAAEEARKKAARRKCNISIGIAAVALLTAVVLLVTQVIIPMHMYNTAVALEAEGDAVRAAICFGKVGDRKDAAARSMALWAEVAERNVIAAGNAHTVGLQADGTVVAVGYNNNGQCNVDGWKDIVAIAAGNAHTVGLRSDGTVVAVGSNFNGRCDVDGWEDIVAIAAGNAHTVGLRVDGTVVAVGADNDGQCDVGGWEDIVAIAAGNGYTVGLQADSTVVAVGYNGSRQCEVSGWKDKDIVAIAAGDAHTVGLRADGTVVAVGSNGDGQCKVSDWSLKQIPRPTLPE